MSKIEGTSQQRLVPFVFENQKAVFIARYYRKLAMNTTDWMIRI